MNAILRPLALTAALALATTGCATAPATNPDVERARQKVDSLAQNPMAAKAASEELQSARGALQIAEQAVEEREDPEITSHLAYLAERRAETGLARIDEAEARERIDRSEQERQSVLIESRERQAQMAREEAAMSRAELDKMREEYAALQAKQTDRGMILTLGDVLFDTDQATLKPGAMVTIDRLAEFLERNQGTHIRIEGHTDSVGASEYNAALSERRARAVADALVTRGTSSARVATEGRGEGFPVATNDTTAGRQQNRRVEVVFSDPEGRFAARG